jgi:hypothetical protein
VVLAGFMRILTPVFVSRYAGRLVNIHPSLLPAFPGLHTHQRAIDAGCKFAGATVHLVTAELDHGPILAQAVVPVLPGDTADALAARVLTQEHLIYPRGIADLLQKYSCLRLFDEGWRPNLSVFVRALRFAASILCKADGVSANMAARSSHPQPSVRHTARGTASWVPAFRCGARCRALRTRLPL